MEGALPKEGSHEISDESTSALPDEKMPAVREPSNLPMMAPCKDPPKMTAPVKTVPAKRTRKKDKNKPKRPLSAYNIFFKEERLRYLEEEVQEETPAGGPKDKFLNMSREIGRRWMNLSSDRRKIYEAMAEEAMFRYRVSMDAYKARKQFEDANLLVHQHHQQQHPSAATASAQNQDTRSAMETHSAQMMPNRAFSFADFQSVADSNNNNKSTSVLDSFLRANQTLPPQPPPGLPLHMLHSAARRELLNQNSSNDSLQAAAAQNNLLNYLLLEKMAQNRERELAEDFTNMRLNALLQAHRPAAATVPRSNHNRNEGQPAVFLPDSRWLYESVMQSLHSSASRVQTSPSRSMNQLIASNNSYIEQKEQQKRELLEFVRNQQNPQWAEFLKPPENPNPNDASRKP